MIGTHLQQQLQLFATASATICNISCNYLQQQLQPFATSAATICNSSCNYLQTIDCKLPERRKQPVACCHFLHQKFFHNLQPIASITETCDNNLYEHSLCCNKCVSLQRCPHPFLYAYSNILTCAITAWKSLLYIVVCWCLSYNCL